MVKATIFSNLKKIVNEKLAKLHVVLFFYSV